MFISYRWQLMQYCFSFVQIFPPLTGAIECAWWQSVQTDATPSLSRFRKLVCMGFPPICPLEWQPRQADVVAARNCSLLRNRFFAWISGRYPAWQAVQSRMPCTESLKAAGITRAGTDSSSSGNVARIPSFAWHCRHFPACADNSDSRAWPAGETTARKTRAKQRASPILLIMDVPPSGSQTTYQKSAGTQSINVLSLIHI